MEFHQSNPRHCRCWPFDAEKAVRVWFHSLTTLNVTWKSNQGIILGMAHQSHRQMMMANKFNVREMELPDLDQVKALSKGIYGGTDYTNSVLNQWLENERWYPFCVETSSGEIIGFTALNITDNKTNVVIRSSRIAPDFRGKGIYKAMLDFAFAEVKKKFPTLERTTHQILTKIHTSSGCTLQKLITKIVLQCDSEKCASVHCPKQPEAIFSHFEDTKISFKHLANLYRKDEVLRGLYPMNLLTIEGEVFDITEESNIDYLQSRKEIVVSFSKGLSANNDEKMAVSILNLEPKQTDEGVPCANFDLQSNDVTVATYHLQRALIFVASIMRNAKFNLNVLFNFQHEKEITEFIEKELLCCKVLVIFKMQLLRSSFSEGM